MPGRRDTAAKLEDKRRECAGANSVFSELCSKKCGQRCHERRFVTPKARYHCIEHDFRIEPVEVQWMPGTVSNQTEERELRAAVAFAERMDGVELGKKVRSAVNEVFATSILQTAIEFQIPKQPMHLGSDVLGIAKGTGVFGQSHRAELTRPLVDVLKEMVVDCAVVTKREPAPRQRFLGTRKRHRRFEALKRVG